MEQTQPTRRTIICTTGTSISQGVAPLSGNDREAYRRGIGERLDRLRDQVQDRALFLTRASAETNSLHRLQVSDRDLVVLLHTETDDGQICAEELQRLIAETFKAEVELARIVGLQVSDQRRFRREGIQNLFNEVHRRCRHMLDEPEPPIVLNATGGFKSTVPYLTLYGLMYRLPVVYIFERSDALLWLPPAPIHFDYERLARAEAALRRLQELGAMPKHEFFELIPRLPFHERPWFESLLEEDDGMVTLSAFGFLLAEALEREQSQVYISPAAAKAYEASAGIARSQFTYMLDRVSDPLWRVQKRHTYHNSELVVFKPGKTRERMACIIEGSRVYVCELLDRDDYRRIEGKRPSDYNLAEFVPWSRPMGEPEPPDTEDEQIASLQEEEQKLRTDRDECQRLWADAETRAESLAARLSQLEAEREAQWRLRQQAEERASHTEQELTSVRAELQVQQALAAERAAQIAQLQGELDTCRQQLADLRRPWWLKLWQRSRVPR